MKSSQCSFCVNLDNMKQLIEKFHAGYSRRQYLDSGSPGVRKLTTTLRRGRTEKSKQE